MNLEEKIKLHGELTRELAPIIHQAAAQFNKDQKGNDWLDHMDSFEYDLETDRISVVGSSTCKGHTYHGEGVDMPIDYVMENATNRDPGTFKVGDKIIYDSTEWKILEIFKDGNLYRAKCEAPLVGAYLDNAKLLEFDDLVLGRMRVLQEGEPLEMCGEKSFIWVGGDIQRFDRTHCLPEHRQGINDCQYYMPIGAYNDWKAK